MYLVTQLPFVKDNDLLRTPPDRADHVLDVSVLPR